jgi:phosphatidylinositol alpha-1,6-mannosyltransferase
VGILERYRGIEPTIRDYRADYVFSNSMGSEPLITWLSARKNGMPFGLFSYGKELYPYKDLSISVDWKRWIIRQIALRGANVVFAISQFTRQLLVQLGVSPVKVFIVPPGIRFEGHFAEIATSEPAAKTAGNVSILTVGRLIERKGVDLVLKALPQVLAKFPNSNYIVVGDGPYRDELVNLVQDLDLQDHVSFIGNVSDDEKWQYYKSADLFVMPNRELPGEDVEGFGIVFLEANAFGLPVIGGRSGGAVDAVLDGQTGIIIDPLDVDSLASAMIELIGNPDLAKRLGRRGQQRVAGECNWSRSIDVVRRHLAAQG